MDDRHPEHEKLKAISDTSQAIGEFLSWLQVEGMTICQLGRYEEFSPIRTSISTLLARYFEIDEQKLEREKAAMLADIRAGQPS